MLTDAEGGSRSNGGWSSLIGIITAICGNVLISVALNTQRYAHIRLHERWIEKRKALKAAQRRVAGAGYGTQNAVSSKERLRAQLRRAQTDGGIAKLPVQARESLTGEAAPLLPASPADDCSDDRGDVDDEPDTGPETQQDEAQRKSYLRSPLWWAGQIMMTVGEAGNFLAYGFAPASIVSPLGVVALVSNCIIAPLFLKETFRRRDLLGIIIAIMGAVTVAMSASDDNPKLGADEIWNLIARWEFETYLGVTSFSIVCLMFASNKYGHKSIFIDLGLVGLFGAYTALSTKGVASLLSYTLFKAVTFPLTYLLVAVLVATAVMQIKYLNRALKRFDATQVIPTQFVLFTLSVILGSAVLYRDFERTGWEDASKFVGGCALTFAGVWLITSARSRDHDEEEGFEEDEEAIRLNQGEPYRDELEEPTSFRRHPSINSTKPSENGHIHSQDDIGTPNVSMPYTAVPQTPTGKGDTAMATPTTSATEYPQASSLVLTHADLLTTAEDGQIDSEDSPSKAPSTAPRLLQPQTSMWHPDAGESLTEVLPQSRSAPVLPTEARIQPETPRTLSTAAEVPVAPATPHTVDRSYLLSRQSLSTLVPAPLGGTMSTPLSAIVADSLRRGVDTSSVRRSRTRRLRLPGMPWNGQLRRRGNSDLDAAQVAARDDLRQLYSQSPSGKPRNRTAVEQTEEGEQTEARRSRTRSLSSSLAELFRRKRPKLGISSDETLSPGTTTPSTEPGPSSR